MEALELQLEDRRQYELVRALVVEDMDETHLCLYSQLLVRLHHNALSFITTSLVLLELRSSETAASLRPCQCHSPCPCIYYAVNPTFPTQHF